MWLYDFRNVLIKVVKCFNFQLFNYLYLALTEHDLSYITL